jgi:transposase
MASLRKSKVHKYTYWQIVESKRINGKPQPVVLMHLGTAEQLLYKLKEGPILKTIRSASHGAVELFFQTAKGLDLVATFNRVFSSQVRNELTVGESLLVAAIHRAIKPDSKRSFAEWAKQTTLPELMSFQPDKLDSQHFWDQMETVTEEQLREAEHAITLKLIDQGLVSSKLLFYDLTNFFTHIASDNQRSDLAKRGRNKQKRHDLRQFGLTQVVTREFLIPVFSEVYEGNITDKELFAPFLTKVREKLSALNLEIEEFTVVFDKGSNSKANFAKLDASEIPYVASLTPGYHEDLLNVPLSLYKTVNVNGKETLCYRTQKEVWGKDRTIIVYISSKLRQGQIQGLKQALSKKYQLLEELKAKLNAPRARKRNRTNVEAQIKGILTGERCNQILDVTLTEQGEGRFDIEWEINTAAYQWVTENLYGKRILVTCRNDWPEEEVIAAYHGQSHVERAFKHLKNPYHNSVYPQYHWTDQKIKVHTFICLTGLLMSQILWKQAREVGYTHSLEKLIDKLTEVRMAQVVILTGFKTKPVTESRLEDMEPNLQKLYQSLQKQI